MLDQNTDRMWNVIGAILIGAAILFGFNHMAPSAFAQVAGLFDEFTDSIGVEQQLVDLEVAFGREYWEDGGIQAQTGGELNSDHWKQARIRHKDYHPIDQVETFEMTFNYGLYRLYGAFYDEQHELVGNTGWQDQNVVVSVPDSAMYIRFTAGPFDRVGSGKDSGISMDEFDALNVRFKVVNRESDDGGE